MEIDIPAQLYTARGKYSIKVHLNASAGIIQYFDPERSEPVMVGLQCNLRFAKNRRFFFLVFSDFWITDNLNSPPLWKHKLTVYKSDADQVIQALAVLYPAR